MWNAWNLTRLAISGWKNEIRDFSQNGGPEIKSSGIKSHSYNLKPISTRTTTY